MFRDPPCKNAMICCSGAPCLQDEVVVCCSVLPCIAVCCSVLQCVAVCSSVFQHVTACYSVLQRVTALQYVQSSCFRDSLCVANTMRCCFGAHCLRCSVFRAISFGIHCGQLVQGFIVCS